MERPGGDGDTATVPVIPRGVIVLLGAAGAVVALGGMYAFQSILGPVFLALMLVVAVSPLQGLLERRGVPRWLGVIILLAAVYLILLALVATLVFSIARLATLLPTYADDVQNLVDEVENWLAGLGVGPDQIESALGQIEVNNVVGVLDDVLRAVAGLLSNLLLLVILIFFMGLDAAGFPERMVRASRVRPDVVFALTSFAKGTRRYLVVSTVFGAIVAVIDGFALWLLGIPLPVLWGLLAFITNYIPNIGFVIGLIPPAILGLLEGGWVGLIQVIVVYSVINVVIQSFIQPKFVGDSVGISTTLSFVSLVFWAWVIGPLGALLAIPLTLLSKALLLDMDPSTRWLNLLIGSNPPRSRSEPAPGDSVEELAGLDEPAKPVDEPEASSGEVGGEAVSGRGD